MKKLFTKWSYMNNIDKCWISKHSRKFKYTKYRYTKIIIVGNLIVMVLIPVSWAERVVFYTTPLNHLHSLSDWNCIFDHIVHTFCRRCSRSQKFSIWVSVFPIAFLKANLTLGFSDNIHPSLWYFKILSFINLFVCSAGWSWITSLWS